jgi:chromosome segregation ATPase
MSNIRAYTVLNLKYFLIYFYLFFVLGQIERMDTSGGGSSEGENSSKLHELYEENKRLNEVITKCQQKIRVYGIECKQYEDRIALMQTEIKELNEKNDDTEYELDKTKDKAFKLDRQLADTLVKLNNLQKQAINNAASSTQPSSNSKHIDQNGHVIANHIKSDPSLASSAKPVNLTDKQVCVVVVVVFVKRNGLIFFITCNIDRRFGV